ncbi:DNA-binding transcriptional LysR family regulator [Rathayibacter iranicus NCPPB 2253 = VKM Ac-1602]|nr:DNA-binding transcriptional LysR family regulator [Rathayibacter iranicus NCPPB 2253 = VKM Ac-1602]
MTELGAWLLPRAEKLLNEAAELQLEALHYAATIHGVVTLGIVPSVRAQLVPLPSAISAFSTKNPLATVEVYERSSDALIASLRRDELDLVVVGGRISDDETLAKASLGTVPLCIVYRRDSVESLHSPLTDITCLSGHSLLSLQIGSPVRSKIDQILKHAGFSVDYQSQSPGLLHDLVAEGLGLAILPQGLLHPDSRDLIEVPLSEHHFGCIPLYLVWQARATNKPAAVEFRTTILQMRAERQFDGELDNGN